MSHTPLPWRNLGEGCRDYEGAEIGVTGKVVAVICIEDAVDATEQERDDAEFIVKAVNNHYLLLGALVEARAALDQLGCELGIMPEIDAIIKEAL